MAASTGGGWMPCVALHLPCVCPVFVLHLPCAALLGLARLEKAGKKPPASAARRRAIGQIAAEKKPSAWLGLGQLVRAQKLIFPIIM
jgi:hypothetical protein